MMQFYGWMLLMMLGGMVAGALALWCYLVAPDNNGKGWEK